MIVAELPDTMARLPRDRRGLPVPHVAGWTSETWGVARAEHRMPGGPMALFCHGRQGRGRPQFDVVNEERQRRAVMLGRCQVCDQTLPMTHGPTFGYTAPFGWLPASSIEHETRGYIAGGIPVTHEPLCCRPCAVWVAAHCCALRRHDDPRVIRVDKFDRIVQMIDPSADQPRKHSVPSEDLERLGRIARRQNPVGLVGFVKVALTAYEIEDVT